MKLGSWSPRRAETAPRRARERPERRRGRRAAPGRRSPPRRVRAGRCGARSGARSRGAPERGPEGGSDARRRGAGGRVARSPHPARRLVPGAGGGRERTAPLWRRHRSALRVAGGSGRRPSKPSRGRGSLYRSRVNYRRALRCWLGFAPRVSPCGLPLALAVGPPARRCPRRVQVRSGALGAAAPLPKRRAR